MLHKEISSGAPKQTNSRQKFKKRPIWGGAWQRRVFLSDMSAFVNRSEEGNSQLLSIELNRLQRNCVAIGDETSWVMAKVATGEQAHAQRCSYISSHVYTSVSQASQAPKSARSSNQRGPPVRCTQQPDAHTEELTIKSSVRQKGSSMRSIFRASCSQQLWKAEFCRLPYLRTTGRRRHRLSAQ